MFRIDRVQVSRIARFLFKPCVDAVDCIVLLIGVSEHFGPSSIVAQVIEEGLVPVDL